jgi:signal transduction histidine kinase
LLSLLDALLDLSKLDAGKMTFSFARVELDRLIQQGMNEFSSVAAERALTLHYDPPITGSVQAVLDEQRISQVIRNIISNAIKFSPDESSVEIELCQDSNRAAVTIRDNGPGIPEDELETIFDKFVQSSATKTGAGGTGLGLAICREIIAAHQGRIWAENQPGGGTKITFELPVQSPATERHIRETEDPILDQAQSLHPSLV